VVEVLPVEPASAAAYLAQSGTADTARWASVIKALCARTPSPCGQALRSPLMLSLARTVYQAPVSDPAELVSYATVAQVEDRLLDGLIPAVYGRDAADITAEAARRWLSFLADSLPVLGPGAVAWWRLPRCVPQWKLHVAAVLGYGLAGWLWMVLWSLASGFSWGPYPATVLGFAVGAVIGFVGAAVAAPPSVPSQWRRPGTRDLVGGLKTGLPFGLGVGLAVGFAGTATVRTSRD